MAKRVLRRLKDVLVIIIFLAFTAALVVGILSEFWPASAETLLFPQDQATDVADDAPPLSTPLKLSIPDIEIENKKIKEYTDKMVQRAGGVVDPSSMNDVVWWSGGGRPGATVENSIILTTYIYGHAANNDRKAIFDDIDMLEQGDIVTIEADSGLFTYEVQYVFLVDKVDQANDIRVALNQEGRLLLISCWKEPGTSGRTTQNVIAVAQFISFSAFPE